MEVPLNSAGFGIQLNVNFIAITLRQRLQELDVSSPLHLSVIIFITRRLRGINIAGTELVITKDLLGNIAVCHVRPGTHCFFQIHLDRGFHGHHIQH